MLDELGDFIAERNAMLLAGDVDRAIAFWAKWSDYTPWSRHMAEVALHKARTAVNSLPVDVRRASKQWLVERGYQPFDDGEV
jgi:hypothetical protein